MSLVKYEDIIDLKPCEQANSKNIRLPLGFSDKIEWLSVDENILVIGGAGIGRTTFLRSLVFHIVTQYDASEVQAWLYDAGLGLFNSFSLFSIPHICPGTDQDSSKGVVSLINSLDNEVTKRMSFLAKESVSAPQLSVVPNTLPKGIVFLNCAETFFKYLRALPDEYSSKFSHILQVANAVNICVVMCIQDHAYFLWSNGITEQLFPRKIAIVRNPDINNQETTAPCVLLSDDRPLPWLSPIWLSQTTTESLLKEMYKSSD